MIECAEVLVLKIEMEIEVDKERKREIITEYKQRKETGGVFRLVNEKTGRYWLKAERDLESFKNRIEFSKRVNTCPMGKMQKEWNEFGAGSFLLEILEEIEKKETESRTGFRDRLKKLEESWAEKFDKEKAY